MRKRPLVIAALLVGACGTEGLLQGDSYAPDGTLPIAPPTDRSDAGGPFDAGEAGLPVYDAGPDANVAPLGSCEVARSMGVTSGDTGGTVLTAQGNCSEWVSLRATEDDTNAFGTGMSVKLTLEPKGFNFDLYAFFNPAFDAPSCNIPFARSESSGTEVIPLTWGEGTIANGNDDVRTISVLVLSTGPACPPNASWTLTAEGHR